MKPVDVILAEDNDGDIFLVQQALDARSFPHRLTVLTNGDEVKAYMHRLRTQPAAACPDIFLLDLNIPKTDGHAILAEFRSYLGCLAVPVVIITSSATRADRERALSLGATEVFRKPMDIDEYMKLGELVERLVSPPAMP